MVLLLLLLLLRCPRAFVDGEQPLIVTGVDSSASRSSRVVEEELAWRRSGPLRAGGVDTAPAANHARHRFRADPPRQAGRAGRSRRTSPPWPQRWPARVCVGDGRTRTVPPLSRALPSRLHGTSTVADSSSRHLLCVGRLLLLSATSREPADFSITASGVGLQKTVVSAHCVELDQFPRVNFLRLPARQDTPACALQPVQKVSGRAPASARVWRRGPEMYPA